MLIIRIEDTEKLLLFFLLNPAGFLIVLFVIRELHQAYHSLHQYK